MKPNVGERCIYHVGPWRRAVPWLLFGPFWMLAMGMLFFPTDGDSRMLGTVLSVVLSIAMIGMHALISYARLELSTHGVRLRQIGMNLTAPWSNVAGLRLETARQGIVTREPIAGRGAAVLAAFRGVGTPGVPMYGDEQRTLMAERRWIPIEPFAWHLKRGRLLEDIARFAPHVQPLPTLLATPSGLPSPAQESPKDRISS